MRIRNEELNVSSEEKYLQSRLETVQGRSCEWSTATGSMQPGLRRRMHVRRTLSSSAELQGREQTTEFDLQYWNLHRARINMQGPVRASLCTPSEQFELDALCHRPPMQPITNQASDVRVFSCTAKHPCRSIHHTLQTIKSIVRQSSENAVTVVNPADYKAVD